MSDETTSHLESDREVPTAEADSTAGAMSKMSRRGREGRDAAPRKSPLLVVLGWVQELVIVVVVALVISSLIRAFLGQVFVIPSGSMENTLQINDRVVVSKVTEVHRGDVVVFKDPGGWLTPAAQPTGWRKAAEFLGVLPDTSDQHLIKRIIGMPGDTVKWSPEQKQLSINGTLIDESSYLYGDAGGLVEPATVAFEVVVPQDTVFVMGDHRNDSFDSRCHLADITNDGRPRGASAFVPLDDVVGPAVQIVAPLDRWRTMKRPAVFDTVAAAGAAPQQATIVPEGVGCQ